MTAIPDGSLKYLELNHFFTLSLVFYVTYTGNKIMANFWLVKPPEISNRLNYLLMDLNFQQVKSTQQTPRGNATLEKYALIQSSSFLCTLSNLPKLTLLGLGETLQLSDRDYTFFGTLASLRQNILSAIKVMKGRVLS